MPDQDPSDAPDQRGAAAAKKTGAAGAAKKSSPKKAVSKKTTPKKAVAKKTAAKKTATKKTATKKTAARKAVSKRAAPKKAAAKKAAPTTDVATADVAKTTDDSPPEPTAPEPSFPPAHIEDLDRPWLESYPPLVPESYPYPDVAFTRLLDDAAKDFPDSVAIDFLGKSLSYRRLSEQVDRFATALRTLGVAKGDRVGIALPNCPQHLISFMAVLRLAAVVVEMDVGLDERGLAQRINDSGCKVLVVLDPVYAKVESLKGQVPTVEHVIGTAVADYLKPLAATVYQLRHRRNTRLVHKIPAAEGVLRFTDLVRRHPGTSTQEAVHPGTDVALLAYEAADDGTVRAVTLTHRNLLVSVFQIRLWIPDVQAGRETIMCAVPFSTPYGLIAGMGLGMLAAAAMALVPSFDRDEAMAFIARRKPTLLPASSTIIEAMASAPALGKHDLSSIRASLCDTSLLSSDVVKIFEDATGARLREGLALPEATALTLANPVYGKAKPGHVGLPLSDTVCALVDPSDHTQLAGGPKGELAVYGPQVMKGYWRRPEDTAAAVVDGWLFTGFLAEVDDDGYFCLLGRVS